MQANQRIRFLRGSRPLISRSTQKYFGLNDKLIGQVIINKVLELYHQQEISKGGQPYQMLQAQQTRKDKKIQKGIVNMDCISAVICPHISKISQPMYISVDPHRILTKRQPTQPTASTNQHSNQQPISLPTTLSSSGSPIDALENQNTQRQRQFKVKAFELYPISEEKGYENSQLQDLTSQRKDLFQLGVHISSILCQAQSSKHIAQLGKIQELMQNWLSKEQQENPHIIESYSIRNRSLSIPHQQKSESASYKPPTQYWFSSSQSMTHSSRHRKVRIRHIYCADIV